MSTRPLTLTFALSPLRGARANGFRGSRLFALVALLTSSCGVDRFATTTDSATGDAGVAGDDGGGASSCVSVTGGGLEPWLDLQIAGRQFDAYEGRRIRVVVSNHAGGRLGVADAAIAGGAFAMTIPATFNYGYYTEIALYVDDDTDDACDVGEPLWGFVTGIVQETLVIEVTPDGPCISGGGPSMIQGCHPWRPPVAPCVINGQADLTMPLPCPG